MRVQPVELVVVLLPRRLAGMREVENAARTLRDSGDPQLLMACMGFTEAHRRAARLESGLPVLMSNALIAKMTAEIGRASCRARV